MQNIKELLSEHEFFKGLSDEQIEIMAGCGSNVHFKKGETVFQQGREANYFYVVRQGSVALDIDGAERGIIRIQTVEDGDILGWSWLIPPHIWNFTAIAVKDTSTTALDGKCLREKCEKDHELGYALLKRFSTVLAKRLEWTRIQLLDVYGAHT